MNSGITKFGCLIGLLFVFAGVAHAQGGACALKTSQLAAAPELHGFRIGMTIDDARSMVPSLVPGPTDDLGFSTTSFSPEFDPKIDKTAYAGVRTVTLEFLDGRLCTIWIGFRDTFKWPTLDEFVAGMSTSLGIPVAAWNDNSPKRRVDCEDFQIVATMMAGGPSIRITDKNAKATWEQRRTDKANKESEKEEP